ncbi:MAG TPA: response regulator [Anaerolineales bacterium]|nr:response regulator [Anaerolineales bacterium]
MARILFVDDDPFTLETLQKSVQLFGHLALLANSGAQALAMATKDPPDLIMTDMRLPDMDGLTLVNQLKQDPSTAGIAVVILSASPELDAAELTQAAGARDYLLKPVRLQTLKEIIERYAPH